MAESIVESGAIRMPLGFYQELANHLSSWAGFPETDPGPVTRIYLLDSSAVKKLTTSIALCPDGIRSRDGGTIQILLLIAAPIDADPTKVGLEESVTRLLGPVSHRETLLRSKSSAAAWAALLQMESEMASARP